MSVQKKDSKDDLEGHEDQTQDAVFGEITEEGPNYRNVRTSTQPLFNGMADGAPLLTVSGGFCGDGDSHDEDANRPGTAVGAKCVQPAGYCAGDYLSAGSVGHHDVVGICDWKVQDQPPSGVQYR